jgi:protein TonB
VVAQTARQPSEFKDGVLVPPREIPTHIHMPHDDGASVSSAPEMGNDIPGAIPGAPPSPQLNEVLHNTPARMPTVAVPKIRLSSGVTEGMLLRQVRPQYPSLARQARIQGTVVLQAVIGKDGRIENLQLVSGQPMLSQAAIDAVKQWLYRPYYLITSTTSPSRLIQRFE